jgi:uncharacterized membrane protein YdbT with pleckstrin-like domain
MDPNNQQGQPQGQQNEPVDYTQPVAYDTNGRPLYAHPPTQEQVHGSHQNNGNGHPHEPIAPKISDDIRERHAQSVKAFPQLNLSEGEYVIRAVNRHPIGLLSILAVVGLIIIAIAAGAALYTSTIGASGAGPSSLAVSVIALLLCMLVGIGGFIAVYIYMHNRFFLTNESVIQEIQISLFNKHEQTVSLGNIEDASYRQEGLLEHIFNYGSIRLSTQGDETTYRFQFVANPKQHIATLNNAVESFKLGRPV